MTRHPNTPAAIQAIRALLDASMVALTDVTTATPESVAIWNNAGEAIDALASRTEQAAPSVASGVEKELSDARILVLASDYRSTYSHAGTSFDEFDALGFARELLTLAAPGAAIAAREQESINTTRLAWLHTSNKDADGYEYGVCKVRFDPAGKMESFLWTASDSSDVDAAMSAAGVAK